MEEQIEQLIQTALSNIEFYYHDREQFIANTPPLRVKHSGRFINLTPNSPLGELQLKMYLDCYYQIYIFLQNLKKVQTNHPSLGLIVQELEGYLKSTHGHSLNNFDISSFCHDHIHAFVPTFNIIFWEYHGSRLRTFLTDFRSKFSSQFPTPEQRFQAIQKEFGEKINVKSARKL